MSQTHEEPARPRWERAITDMFCGLWEWGVLFCLIAVSLGLALWPLKDFEAMRFIVKNDLPASERFFAGGDTTVHYLDKPAPLTGQAWSEGWHPGIGLDYPRDLDAHADDFVPRPLSVRVTRPSVYVDNSQPRTDHAKFGTSLSM